MPLHSHQRMLGQPAAGRSDFLFDGIGCFPAVPRNEPPDRIEIFGSLRRQPKGRAHSLGASAFRATLTQHFHRFVPIHRLAPFGLCKPCGDLSSHRLAFRDHPILKIELFANDLERAIKNLIGGLIRSRLDGEIDQPLLFGF